MLALRDLRADDYDALISWFPTEASLRDFAGPGPTWPLDRAQLDARAAEPQLQTWTAWQPPSPEPIGHIELMRIGPQQARLDRVAIAPAHRGRGLGLEMVRVALDHSRNLGCLSVDLLVFAANLPARRTYLAAGFADVGAISPEYPDVRRMSLELPS